jgi:molybdopterin/thiamine biosynthesis adenylyltransferase
MKVTALLTTISIAAVLYSCSDDFAPAENSTDAAREFVDAALKGNYRKAYFYLLKDSTNEMMFETLKKSYDDMDPKLRREYKEASIIVIEKKDLNDSLSTFKYYPSSNPKDTTSLRIMKAMGLWQVDLKSVIKI